MKSTRKPAWRTLLICCVMRMFVGCGDDTGEVVIPNKPPLSAEAAKEKAKLEREGRIEALKEQAKSKVGKKQRSY